jgi:hypothetical protein
MAKTTVSTASGAMPRVDRKFVMVRAWEIFRRTYRYPQIKFSDIGRKCFGCASRQAWIEARARARVIEQYAGDLREIIKKLRRRLN